MTKQQQIILAQLESLLLTAPAKRREAIKKQIADFRKSCEPKPKLSRPAWVDKF